MTDRTEDAYEERQRKLRGELLKMKADARTVPLTEWTDKMLAIIERECVRREQAIIEREYEKNKAPVRLIGGNVVEVREGR